MFTHIQVKLSGSDHLWTYKNHVPELELGDHVVVQLPNGRFTMVKVAKVALSEEEKAKATKWVVDRVTFDTDKWKMLTAMQPPPEPKEKKGAILTPSQAAIKHWRNTTPPNRNCKLALHPDERKD